jgi:hypothetical protein
MLTVVHDAESANEDDGVGRRSLLDEIVRDGARQMLAAALQAEVAAYVDQFADQLDQNGRRLVGPQRVSPRTRGADRRGCGHGDRAAGQRQAHRRRYR